MVRIGNFFFHHRNTLFIFLYALLFIPSPAIFTQQIFGTHYWVWPVIIGLVVTVTGQLIRGATIGLAYILRGGINRKIAAHGLVTGGMFNHCRNPLYVGNILMLAGVGILSNSLVYVFIIIPLFILIYQTIVLAEEDYLRNKFGEAFNEYCKRVNRWIPSLKGLGNTFRSMQFKWHKWIYKEYNTQFVWLCGITLVLLFTYPQISNRNTTERNVLLLIILPILLLIYLIVRYYKKAYAKRILEMQARGELSPDEGV